MARKNSQVTIGFVMAPSYRGKSCHQESRTQQTRFISARPDTGVAKKRTTSLMPPLAVLIRVPSYLKLALGDDRSRSLAFADEAAAQTQASDHQRQGQCNFLHNVPLFFKQGQLTTSFVEQLVQESHSGWNSATASVSAPNL